MKIKNKYQEVLELLNLLEISEDEALRAILSVFTSVQPGAVRGTWKKRLGYEKAPSTREFWEIYVRDNFRCQNKGCGSMFQITIDHNDRNLKNITAENLRVMCIKCNRALSGRQVQNVDAQLRVYRALMRLRRDHGQFPSDKAIQKLAGVTQLSGARYMIRFFESKLSTMRKLNSYRSST